MSQNLFIKISFDVKKCSMSDMISTLKLDKLIANINIIHRKTTLCQQTTAQNVTFIAAFSCWINLYDIMFLNKMGEE